MSVATLSARPLETLIQAEAATWLDRELVATHPEPLREAGFGHEVRAAQDRRRQWLIAQRLAQESDGRITHRAGMLRDLERRELRRVAAQMERELELPFAETTDGDRVSGTYRRPVDLASGRFALIEKSREFTLVPWRAVLERHRGKSVSGIMRGDTIIWTFGRQRNGPTIA